MCLFSVYASQEWGDTITLYRGFAFSPAWWTCKDCSLNGGQTWKGRDDNPIVAGQLVLEHLAAHNKAGHKFHEAVWLAVQKQVDLETIESKKLGLERNR